MMGCRRHRGTPIMAIFDRLMLLLHFSLSLRTIAARLPVFCQCRVSARVVSWAGRLSWTRS